MNTSHAFVPLNVHKHRLPCWDNNIIWIVRSHSHEKKDEPRFSRCFSRFSYLIQASPDLSYCGGEVLILLWHFFYQA